MGKGTEQVFLKRIYTNEEQVYDTYSTPSIIIQGKSNELSPYTCQNDYFKKDKK